MKLKKLFAIALTVPSIALACGKTDKDNANTASLDAPHVVAATQEQTSSGATSACCRNAVCDDQGRIVRKPNGDGGYIEYIYHPRSGKLILALNGSRRVTYHYNQNGTLKRAENGAGRVVSLEYGSMQKIRRLALVDSATGERRVMTFRYNAAGKPVFVALAGVGTVRVEYDDEGEIRKVHSRHGAEMVRQVSRAFQIISSITRPGGAQF